MFSWLCVQAQTNNYHPFPDSNAVWNIHYWMACWGSEAADDHYSITFAGDTLIGGTSYHKLTTPYIEHHSTGNCSWTSLGYLGAIRRDGANRKVYFVLSPDTSGQLLYDFNLQVGDAIQGYLGNFAWPADTVREIDSVMVVNSYRKRWRINPCYNIDIIEGIGSTYGLIIPSPGCVTDLPDFTITCFQQNGETLYPDTITACGLITAANPPPPGSTDIKIYPNPVTDQLTIECPDPTIKTSICLCDVHGRNVIQEVVTQAVTIINTRHLQAGVYVLQLRN